MLTSQNTIQEEECFQKLLSAMVLIVSTLKIKVGGKQGNKNAHSYLFVY